MSIPSVSTYDTTVSVWEDFVDEQSMRERIMHPAIRFLRARGWKIRKDPRIEKNYRCLSKGHRVGIKGELHLSIELSGRAFSIEIWQEKYNRTNSNGGKYEFNKRERMPFLLGKRCDLEITKLGAFLAELTGYEVEHRHRREKYADVAIQNHIRTSGHFKEHLGRADWYQDYNRKTIDGKLLEHGQVVWFFDGHGRLQRGTAFYNLNMMWWVRLNKFDYTNKAAHELYADMPDFPRVKRNERRRRKVLESLIQKAVNNTDFLAAHKYKSILFGNDRVFRIWSKDKAAYYGPLSAGYSVGIDHAGLYTEREIKTIVKNSDGNLRAEPVAA